MVVLQGSDYVVRQWDAAAGLTATADWSGSTTDNGTFTARLRAYSWVRAAHTTDDDIRERVREMKAYWEISNTSSGDPDAPRIFIEKRKVRSEPVELQVRAKTTVHVLCDVYCKRDCEVDHGPHWALADGTVFLDDVDGGACVYLYEERPPE